MANLSTTDAAKIIGCDPRTVLRWADRLGVGEYVGGRLILNHDCIQKISQHVREKSGNPHFGTNFRKKS